MASDLKTKTLSGMIWSFVQRFGKLAIAFTSNIILARLLTPNDYGIIGMLMIFIAISNTFVDGGFGSALIQKKNPTKEDYSTIFWWNMVLSIVIYGVLYMSAPTISRFYNIPLLTNILRVQGLILILNALSIIQQNQLRKKLQFKRLATITLTSSTLSASIAIVLAYINWGVWALVAQQLMLSGFTAITLWIVSNWHPSLIFSIKSFKSLFGFGGFLLATNLITTTCNNIHGFLIGKLCMPATLGYYTQARKLEEMLSSGMGDVIDQVSYPILSQFQDSKSQLAAITKRLVLSVSYVSIPILISLIILAHPLVLFLYSDKWLPCVPYLKILSLSGIAITLQIIHFAAVESRGKSKDIFLWTIIKRAVGLILIIVGIIFWGIYGLLWASVAVSWICLFINAYLTDKHAEYKLWQQTRDIAPTIIITIISYAIPAIILPYVFNNEIVQPLIHLILFFVIYISISHLGRIYAYTLVKSTLFEYIQQYKKKKRM